MDRTIWAFNKLSLYLERPRYLNTSSVVSRGCTGKLEARDPQDFNEEKHSHKWVIPTCTHKNYIKLTKTFFISVSFMEQLWVSGNVW